MRSLFVPCLCLIAAASTAETREFRSRDLSKTFQAEFIGYDPGTLKVKVKTQAGALLEFPAASLSEEDQKWAAANATQWRLRIEPKAVEGKDEILSKGSREISKRTVRYDVSVTNLEKSDLNKTEITCQIVYRKEQVRDDKVETAFLMSESTAPLELVAAGKKFVFASPSLTLNSNKPGKCMTGG